MLRIAKRFKNAYKYLHYRYLLHANCSAFVARDFGGYKRVYLFHIRKTGGTSFNHMFLSLAGESSETVLQRLVKQHWSISGDMAYVGWNKQCIEEGQYHYAFSHLPFHAVTLPPDTFTFTCLRDPLQRVISHYKMLRMYQQQNIAHPCMQQEGAWLGDSFADFIQRIPKTDLLNQLYMFSPAFDVSEAYQNIKQLHYYMFTETFDQGISELAGILNLPLSPRHIKKTSLEEDIPAHELTNLTKRLEPEYELLARLRQSVR